MVDYASRGNDPQVRIYFDLDDREAEAILNEINSNNADRKEPVNKTRSSKTNSRSERNIMAQKTRIGRFTKTISEVKKGFA